MKQEHACRYLDTIAARSLGVAESSCAQVISPNFVERDANVSNLDDCYTNRTAALGTPYLLESNIRLLPDEHNPNCLAATDMLDNEQRRARLIGEEATLHYQRYPLSRAVDGDGTTAFRSPYSELKAHIIEHFLKGL